jgi:antitoxin VapB
MPQPDEDPPESKKNELMRLYGSMPWPKPIEKQRHRGRVFKSGNSLAFRIPAGTKLAAGMEMELTIEDGQFLSLEPVEQPRRKFNIAKVAGSARNLQPIPDEDRLFDERPLLWDELRRSGGENDA